MAKTLRRLARRTIYNHDGNLYFQAVVESGKQKFIIGLVKLAAITVCAKGQARASERSRETRVKTKTRATIRGFTRGNWQ